MSEYERNKGLRVEREIVNLLKEAGIFAERVPLSGASRYRGEGHDLNVYAFGRDQEPLVFEVKARKEGAGFTLLKKWLGGFDGLVTREDRAEPLVTLPWHVLIDLWTRKSTGDEDRSTSTRPSPKNGQARPTFARPDTAEGENANVTDESADIERYRSLR